MPRAFKPVENVGAPGVVDLVKRVSVGLLHGHRIANKEQKQKIEVSRCCTGSSMN